MTPTDLEQFMAHMGLNRRRLALQELGISQDRLRRFLRGEQPIPRHIALACSAIAWGLPAWGAETSK